MESHVSEGFHVSSASESGMSCCKMPGIAGWVIPAPGHTPALSAAGISCFITGLELPLSAAAREDDGELSRQDVGLLWKQQVVGRVPH